MEVKFITKFTDKYQRNNKQTGRKNLRCFPGCNAIKHVDTGFCGRAVQLSVHNCDHIAGHVRAWAQFQQQKESDAFSPGQIIAPYMITKRERSKQFPMMPWIRGSIFPGDVVFDDLGFEAMATNSDNPGTMTILINSELMGWHYHWVSNKHTCDTLHVLRVYLFSINSDNDLRCIGAFSSPEFQIYCRRRPKPGQTNIKEESLFIAPLPVHHVSGPASSKRKAASNNESTTSRNVKLRKQQSSTSERTGTLMKIIRHIFVKGSKDVGPVRINNSPNPNSNGQAVSGLDNFTSSLFGSMVTGVDYDFDFMDFGSMDTISLGASANSNSLSTKTNDTGNSKPKSIACDLARFLIEEESFTMAISNFFANACQENITPEVASSLFKKFTALVNEHVEDYLLSRGISMKDLELELNEKAPSRPNTPDSIALDVRKVFEDGEMSEMNDITAQNALRKSFLSRLQRETRPIELNCSKPAPPQYDISGVWYNNGKHEDNYEQAVNFLSRYGYPVLMVQMMRRMFWRFSATLTQDFLVLKGSKKLLSSGEFIFKLDNLDHQMEIQEMSLGLPMSSCMYRAGFSSYNGFPVIRLLLHGYMPRVAHARFEIDRTFGLNVDGSLLTATYECYIIRATGRRQSLGSFKQEFYKVCDDKELTDLLEFTADLF